MIETSELDKLNEELFSWKKKLRNEEDMAQFVDGRIWGLINALVLAKRVLKKFEDETDKKIDAIYINDVKKLVADIESRRLDFEKRFNEIDYNVLDYKGKLKITKMKIEAKKNGK